MVYPPGVFDGATQHNLCGCGAILLLNLDLQLNVYWSEGNGTNTLAKAITLWGLLFFTKRMNLAHINILSDAKVIIDWLNGEENICVPNLANWMDRIAKLKIHFSSIFVKHIFRLLNFVADSLSKRGISAESGSFYYKKPSTME